MILTVKTEVEKRHAWWGGGRYATRPPRLSPSNIDLLPTALSIEQMSIVLRYINSDKEINERFIKFVKCKEVTGEALAKKVEEDTMDEIELSLDNCHGQGYHAASLMSSKLKGVPG